MPLFKVDYGTFIEHKGKDTYLRTYNLVEVDSMAPNLKQIQRAMNNNGYRWDKIYKFENMDNIFSGKGQTK